MARDVVTSCRICAGQCSLILTLDQGEVTAVRGDKDNPVTRGYACIKGLTAHQAHHSDKRILRPLKRMPSGEFREIPLEQALTEIAQTLSAIIERDGADAVAGFRGTMSYSNALANAMLPAWLQALGSHSFFSTMTIDQSAKWVSAERLGSWAAGRDAFALSDVLLLVGTNPLVSLSTFNFPLQNPMKSLKEARARGLKLVVIDPRASETARFADVHLQPLPGEDVHVLAAILHVIISRGWHDRAFCDQWVAGFDSFVEALAPFTPQRVAARSGVTAAEIEAAAAAFAAPLNGRLPRGSAASGTGANMIHHANLAEHLVECLNVVCGRYAREGDPVMNPGVLSTAHSRRAQVVPPGRSWERGWQDEHGWGIIFGERMSATLPDAILGQGRGKVRALIVDGGNPVTALPGAARVAQAFAALELLVAIEPFMTETARLAHYILPPPLMFERHDIGSRDYESIVLFQPYAQYAEPVMTPPAGSETIDDWRVFWELARRLGRPLSLSGEPLPMDSAPDSEALLALMLKHSAVPYPEIRAATAGRLFTVPPMTVLPAEADTTARFAVAPDDVLSELAAVAAESVPTSPEFPLRFACRRVRDVQNSMYHHLPGIAARMDGNPAWFNEQDMAALGLTPGDLVQISSRHGTVTARAEADPALRPGVVSINHGWDDSEGVNVNHLTDLNAQRDTINAMPVMTGFAVRVDQPTLVHGRNHQ